MNERHIYRLRYKFSAELGEFTKEQAGEDGAADALLLVSILRPRDGGLDVAFLSADGHNNKEPLGAMDLFKVWAVMAGALAESEELGPKAKSIAGGALHAVAIWMNQDDSQPH